MSKDFFLEQLTRLLITQAKTENKHIDKTNNIKKDKKAVIRNHIRKLEKY